MARILTYHLSMDNVLINLIGMGTQSGVQGTTSRAESSGIESNQKSFLNILKNILSENENQQTLLTTLNEMQESGESSLAVVMSSISQILLSMIPPGEMNTLCEAPGQKIPDSQILLSMIPPGEMNTLCEAPGQKIPEITGEKIDQDEVENAIRQNETKKMSSWLEQMNFSAFQEILTHKKSGLTENISGDTIVSNVSKEGAPTIEEEHIKAFQEEMIRLFSYLNGKSEMPITNNNVLLKNIIEDIPIQNIPVIPIQRTIIKENSNTENNTTNAINASGAADFSSKEIVEKNAFFLHEILGKERKVHRDENIGKDNSLQENKSIDELFKSNEKLAQNMTQQSFGDEQGFDEKGGDSAKNGLHTLIFNATKKYKEHLSEVQELKTAPDTEITNMPAQKITGDVPQSDSFKANILQVKDNNMTFERGSFTSFVTDRIEKIVEQFSSRASQMDMIVRLKLDDKETLLVGLKHDGQKIIVDVKASNDGLVNLIQTHKDDIARHLEDKNIFTHIFVQPDGERNSERQNRQQNKKEERKKEADTAFINILEATA